MGFRVFPLGRPNVKKTLAGKREALGVFHVSTAGKGTEERGRARTCGCPRVVAHGMGQSEARHPRGGSTAGTVSGGTAGTPRGDGAALGRAGSRHSPGGAEGGLGFWSWMCADRWP